VFIAVRGSGRLLARSTRAGSQIATRDRREPALPLWTLTAYSLPSLSGPAMVAVEVAAPCASVRKAE